MYFPGLSKEDIVSKNRVESNKYEQSCKKNQLKMVTLFGQKIEAPGTKRSEKVTGSSESGLFDLNETPINEPVSDFFQDLNFQYTEETRINSEKSGFTPICLDKVHGKDGTSSQSSCCTAENNSRIEREHSCKVIQIAAECLVHISMVSLNQSGESNNSSQDQDFQKKPEIGIEEPSTCSCDSYELHVLGIRETVLEDESCVSSSKTMDVFNNKKESGIKVRRGKKRMKNFQKEILPELVSLSRNEIREDINILEAILRSREYKKIQGTGRDGSKCKGSAQGYVGRRRRKTE